MEHLKYPNSLRKPQKCSMCNGSGLDIDNHYHNSRKKVENEPCEYCRGKGSYKYKHDFRIGDFSFEVLLLNPHGKRRKKNKWCVEVNVREFGPWDNDDIGPSYRTVHLYELDAYGGNLKRVYKKAFKNMRQYIKNGYMTKTGN